MFYSTSDLDRADQLRTDATAIATLRQQSNALIVPVWHRQSLVAHPDSDVRPQATFLAHDATLPAGQSVFLGINNTVPYFAVDVSNLNDSQRDQLASHARTRDGQSTHSTFSDLRSCGPTLSDQDGSLLAYARGMLYWNENTRHCLRCGHLHKSEHAGHVRRCTNSACEYMVFPRTDPAVIMLVIHTPKEGGAPVCLLGRNASWPEGVYSTLAGFVEPGESLENAVAREVYEEAGIHTSDVRYVASQPWPFPRSIMLGFEAVATSTEINIDTVEIEDAQWFSKDQLQEFGIWGDDAPGYKLPRTDSIARYLIDRWMGGEH